MSRLTDITEQAAIRVIEDILTRFEDLDGLGVSAEDAFEIRKAENLLRAVAESSPHYTKRK
ncbi:hypothetical protein LRS05_10590 [Flavobacterium sp. J372]|jgi:hypothetical protein|uniref:hypothetical protein n=1 Tax=Flavobacterium sp. J372 TaxID=2898436 RepID=UPI0021509803|nr:hypothetical protein [Flavobacterium sp. J372]MCR5862568.1 hypothetical protein [Flavobacterium sp. J372]